MDDSDEIECMSREAFICPNCGETIGGNEAFTIEPIGPLGYMLVRCATCSPRLEKDLA
jgi:hypothetical protein